MQSSQIQSHSRKPIFHHKLLKTLAIGPKPDMAQEKFTEEHLEEHSHATKNESGITLVPEPTDDPRDPLVCHHVDCRALLERKLKTIAELVTFQKTPYALHRVLRRLYRNSTSCRQRV